MPSAANLNGHSAPLRVLERVLAYGSVGLWLPAAFWFTAIAPARRAPDASLGRVYAWPNHGDSVYLSRGEDFALKGVHVASPVMFLSAVIINRRRVKLSGTQ